ncbi:DUF4297 domain-containing protein [Priestia sp. Y58]|uniref:dsDNA nuclease domain-containing protein n=1 Tax=Priestia sp. Y58 TaxID=2922804 RepID=UPI002405C410|nr:dsDNA nuclease domain-containing protein [Priestia sp. Y58]MDG0029965.1 DUF4297 domain-containing protein [Priestia sp. Y58]
MSLADYYMNLPYDLSGSMAKNRFRNEILWGLKKMLELYRENVEFTVVFDYSCDIEVHKENCFEFYQVKTQNNNGTYTVEKLTKKNKSGDSILGKLYRLKYNQMGEECDETVISLVSNAPLNDGKKIHNNIEKVELKDIENRAILLIKKSIKEELKLEQGITLENSNFIKTGIDLIDPEKTLIGETALFFEEKFNCEPKKINSLYRILSSEIFNKASFELQLTSYEELLKKKGIDNSFLDSVLNNYLENTDNIIDTVKEFINEEYKSDFRTRVKLNKALSQVLRSLHSSKHLQYIENEIIQYIKRNINFIPGSDLEIIEVISEKMNRKKTIEISEEEIKVLVLLVLKRFVEGIYEL